MAIPRPSLQPLPLPRPVSTRPVQWAVQGGQFSLDAKGYENLSYNMAEFYRWASEAYHQLGYYHDGLSK